MRTPLRPLARILRARATGENPDLIERENLAQRHEAMRDRAPMPAPPLGWACWRVLSAAFFLTIGVRMGHLAASEPMRAASPRPRAPRSSRSAPISSTATAGSWPPT